MAVNRKRLSEMTLEEKMDFLRYSGYKFNEISMEECLKAFDEEFFDAYLVSTSTFISLGSFARNTQYSMAEFYEKLGDSSSDMNSRQEKFLKSLIAKNSASISDIIVKLSPESREKIKNYVQELAKDATKTYYKSAGNLYFDMANSLDPEMYKSIFKDFKNLTEYDYKRILDSTNYIFNNKDFKEYVIQNLDASNFYYYAEVFNYSKEDILKRQKSKIDVLKNAKNMSFASVKNAMADLMFRTNHKNAVLDIETILIHADSNKEYKEHLGGLYDYLKMVKNVFESDKEPENYQKNIDKIVSNIMSEVDKLQSNNINFFDVIQKETEIAKKSFCNTMEGELLKTKETIFEGADSKTIENNGISVPVYTVAKQTPNQEKFKLLVHTQEIRGETPEEVKQGYYDLRCNRSTNCCSVLSETHMSVFIESQVIFGYFGFHGSELLSATSTDGQTNQMPIALRGDKKCFMQEYLDPDTFINNSGKSHNELAFSSTSTDEHGVLKPDYILCYGEPREQDLLAAAAFNVPIIKIEKELYKQNEVENTSRRRGYYSYPVIDKPETREQQAQLS